MKRVNALLKDIERGNFDGIGKPEPLKDEFSGGLEGGKPPSFLSSTRNTPTAQIPQTDFSHTPASSAQYDASEMS